MRTQASRDAALEIDPFLFAIELLEMEGAAVEAVGTRAEVLLPTEIARALGWEDLTRLVASLDETEPGVRAVGYGSAELERLIEMARETGSVLCLRADVPSPGQRDLTAESQRRLRFDTRGPVTFGASTRSSTSYLRIHYALAAASEDTREVFFAVVINETTLAPVPHLSGKLDALGRDLRPGGLSPGVGSRPLAEVFEAAHREASRLALEHLGPFLASMERRRLRDSDRLRQYYEALSAEVSETRGRGRRLAPEAAADRLAAIRAEFERKLRDLDLRYAVRVRLRPSAVERITVPSLTAPCTLRWKRAERQFAVVWNPVLHEIEPLACDACGAGSQSLHVGEDLRTRCPGCRPVG